MHTYLHNESNRNGLDLTDAEDIKKTLQEHKE